MGDVVALAVPDPDDDSRKPVPLDTSYEIELDPAPSGPAELVESTPPAPDLRPAVPQQWRTREGRRIEIERHWRLLRHRVAVHGIRAPVYLVLAVMWAAVGVFRVAGKQVRWWWVLEQHALRSAAVEHSDSREWMRLHKEAKDTRRVRGYVLAAEALAIIGLVAFLEWFGRWWAWLLLSSVLLAPLARAGRPADKRIITPAVVTPRFRRLNADIVLRAYYAAGLGHPDKPDQQVTFGSTMARDGEGSRVLVDLPYGLGLTDAVNSREKIASGLDVQVSQVFLHRDPTSHRRHVLWVADRDPLAVPVGRTPLLACRATDIWKPAPLGLDERGQLVAVLMMWHSFLFGGMPRQGKTWSMRLLAMFAALDPFVMLDVFDASGKPDWRKFRLVADSCAFGLTPTRDGKPPEILLETLIRTKGIVEKRYEKLSGLPTDVCPEGKLTRKLARDPRFGMPVRVLVLDEVQEYFLLGKISETIAELLVYLAKVAPGAGVVVLDGTQRPSGIGTGNIQTQFVNFRDQHQVKFALRTPSWKVSDLVLGDGAYSAGLDSSALLPQYKGVGILRGASDANPTTRCYTADDTDAERILAAARGLRERAGTLTGYAAGVEAAAPARDVLGDVLAVFRGEPGLQWQILAARLATQIPERWEGVTGEAISQQCRDLGVPSVDVKQFGRSLMGCRREHVERQAHGDAAG